jgi:hypothetical protein
MMRCRVTNLSLLHIHFALVALQVSIRSCPNLAQMAPWIAASAGVTSSSVCPAVAPVVIDSATALNRFRANRALVSATELGTVVITWSAITSTQLAQVLQGKTVLGELVIENCPQITSLSPALDSLVNVSTRIVIDNLDALTSVTIPMLARTGSGVRIYGLAGTTSIAMPQLQFIGGTLELDSNTAVTSVAFGALRTVNGSLTTRVMRSVGGSVWSTAFGQLVTVQGRLQFWATSQSGASARSALVLPQLRSVGSFWLRETNCLSFTAPVLASIGGVGQSGEFYFFRHPLVTALHFPSLASVSGQITFQNMNMLTNLCQIGLASTGYTFGRAVRWFARSHIASFRTGH